MDGFNIRSPLRPAKKGEQPTLEWAMWVEKSLRRLMDEPTNRNKGIIGVAPDPPPFCPIKISKLEDGSFEVEIQEGHIVERDVISGEAMTYFDPDIADVETATTIAISTRPRPVFAMALEDTAVLRYQTDEYGNVTGTPEVKTYSTVPVSAHYQPENPEGESDEAGIAGDYYVKLFKITADGDDYKTILFQQSDVEHYHEITAIENTDNAIPSPVGESARLFKKRDIATGKSLIRKLISGQTASLLSEQACRVEVTENADNAEIKVFSETPDVDGDDFNVEFYTWGITSDSFNEVFTTKLSPPVFTIYVRNGSAYLTDDMAVVTVYEAVADLVGGL